MDRQQLENALRNAHRAGDENAARRLASELQRMQQTAPAQGVPDAPAPVQQQERQPGQAREEYQQLPWWQQALQAGDDVARLAANGMTFGFRDKVAPFLGGAPVEEQRRMTADAHERAGTAGIAAEMLGPAAAFSKIPSVAGAINSAMSNAGRLSRGLGTMAGGALEGAAYGGLHALGHDQDVMEGQRSGAAFGAGAQAVTGILSGGINAANRAMNKPPTRLSVEDLFDQKNAAYRAVKDSGTRFTPEAMDDLLGQLRTTTKDAWAIRHPQTVGMMKRLENTLRYGQPTRPRGKMPPRKSLTLDQIDQTRQAIAKNIAGLPDGPEAEFGRRMVETMDDFMRNVDPAQVTSQRGSPTAAINQLERARELNSRMRKLEDVGGVVTKAERRASRNVSGRVSTAVRGNVDSILGSPKKMRGFSPDEAEAMDRLVRGGPGQNFAGQLGRLAPGEGLAWGGMGTGAGVGAMATGGSPVGAAIGASIPPVVGALGKRVSEGMTSRSTDKLLDLIASGGNASSMTAGPAIDEATRRILERLLTLSAVQQN